MRKLLILIFCIFFLAACSKKPKVIWEKYDAVKLAEAKSAKMPVVIDFDADWCVSCHELDDYTFTDPTVIRALDAFRRMKVDLTHDGDKEVMKLAERFNIEGLPTIIFLGADGEEIKGSRIEGFFPPPQFVALVQSVVKAKKEPAAK